MHISCSVGRGQISSQTTKGWSSTARLPKLGGYKKSFGEVLADRMPHMSHLREVTTQKSNANLSILNLM